MDNKHPKRKKDQLNNYVLKITEDMEYILSFRDYEGKLRKLKIDEALYQLFNSFELEDISYLNEISRHYEHSELTEQTLNNRAVNTPQLLEDEVIKKIEYSKLYQAINELPDIQRKRLIQYYFYNMKFEEIAINEGCSKSAIAQSVCIAKNNLKEILEK